MMKRWLKLGALCAAVLLVAFLAIRVVMDWPRPVVVEMNEPIILDQEENMNTSGIFNFHRDLMMEEGAFEITLRSAELLDSPADAGLPHEEANEVMDRSFLVGKNVKFLLLTIDVKNLDAKNWEGADEFHLGGLALVSETFFTGLGVFNHDPYVEDRQINQNYDPGIVYFDKHMLQREGQKTSPYFHFILPPGESDTFKIGFLVRSSYIESTPMVLSYALNKYASRIEVAHVEKSD